MRTTVNRQRTMDSERHRGGAHLPVTVFTPAITLTTLGPPAGDVTVSLCEISRIVWAGCHDGFCNRVSETQTDKLERFGQMRWVEVSSATLVGQSCIASICPSDATYTGSLDTSNSARCATATCGTGDIGTCCQERPLGCRMGAIVEQGWRRLHTGKDRH